MTTSLCRPAILSHELHARTRSSRRPRWILLGAALALALLAENAAGQTCSGCNTTGAWTPPGNDPDGVGANWGYSQIHLALLRGGNVNGVDYHSYLISWAETGVAGSNARGLHGWNPGDPGWNSYPSETYLKSLGLPDTDVNLFCAGHSTIDARLMVSGGHVGHDIGIVDARIFDPATRTWSTPADTMHYARWYGTNTTLPSGKVLTTSGSRFYRTLTFGGSTNLADAAASIDGTRPGHLRFPIIWESPLSETGPWPSAREGHSAVWLKNHSRMVVFGGRGTDGNFREDTWLLEYKQEDPESYVYDWQQVTGAPGQRYGHVAVSGWGDNSMVVYGGKDNAGVVSDKVNRFRPNGTGGWIWDPELSQSGPAPGARWGHAAAWDDQNSRMVIFGGRTQSGFADDKIYDLTVSGSTATWRQITPTGTGPVRREGHSVVWDSEEYNRPDFGPGSWKRLILFGGQNESSARLNDAWTLWYQNSNPTGMRWESVSGGTPPPARTRHAAFWDFTRLRMVVIGGDTGGSSSRRAPDSIPRPAVRDSASVRLLGPGGSSSSGRSGWSWPPRRSRRQAAGCGNWQKPCTHNWVT